MSSPQCPEDFNRVAAPPADENPYLGIDIVRFKPSISKMLDRIMVEHAFGTKLTFHRNAPFEASLEPDVRESAEKCGKDLSENGLAVAEAIETRELCLHGRARYDALSCASTAAQYNRIAMKYDWGKDRGDGDNNHLL